MKPWVAALQIKENDYQEWLSLCQPSESVTFWAIENGRIDANGYMDWARNFYGLPVVSSAYFEQPPNRTLWVKIKTVANWSPSMVPLEEWDGVVFIGCVEPDESIQWNFPVAYVICQPRDLKDLWSQLQNHESTFSSVSPTPSLSPVKPEAVPAQKDAPLGLNLNIGAAVPPSVPEFTAAHLETSMPAISLVMETPQPPAVTPSPPPAIEAALADTPPQTPTAGDIPNQGLFFQDDIPTGVFELPPTPGHQDGTATTAAANENAKPQSDLQPFHLMMDSAPAQIEEAKSADQAMTWFAKNALVQYQHVIFLVYEGNLLKTLKVTPNLHPSTPEALAPVDPTKASVFRIVRRTNLPYHGPVVDSEINQQFFKNWGMAEYPAIVTTLPLTVQGQARGQILALGDEKCAPQEILQMLERLSGKLSSVMNQWELLAA